MTGWKSGLWMVKMIARLGFSSERRRRHLSVRADCWICLRSLVSWSASGGSWWGKHLQHWMRSWPSRCTSLSSPYSCRERRENFFRICKKAEQVDQQRGDTSWGSVGGCGVGELKGSYLMGTSLYWGWPGWVLPSSGVWVTVGMDLFTNTCLFSTLSPERHMRHIAQVYHSVRTAFVCIDQQSRSKIWIKFWMIGRTDDKWPLPSSPLHLYLIRLGCFVKNSTPVCAVTCALPMEDFKGPI